MFYSNGSLPPNNASRVVRRAVLPSRVVVRGILLFVRSARGRRTPHGGLSHGFELRFEVGDDSLRNLESLLRFF